MIRLYSMTPHYSYSSTVGKGGTRYGLSFSHLELGQVLVHLALKLRGEHIRQRGDIASSTAPVFGLSMIWVVLPLLD